MSSSQQSSEPVKNRKTDISEESLSQDDRSEYLLRLYRETMAETIESNRKLNEEVGVLSSLVRNQSDVLATQLRTIHDRISDLSDYTSESLGKIAKELAERKKMDSIHEEEITGVKHNVELVKAEAGYAVRTIDFVKEMVTKKNVAKGTFLAVVVTVIEKAIQNIPWDKIFG